MWQTDKGPDMNPMTRHAERTAVTDEILAELPGQLEGFLANASERPTSTYYIAKYARMQIAHRLLVDPDGAERATYDSVLLAAQAGTGFFAAANKEGRFPWTLGDDDLLLKAVGPTRIHSAADWLDALWTAVICRAQHLVVELCATPTDTLRNAGGRFDEYMYAWVDALKAFFTRDEDLYPRINRSIELTAPEELTGGTPPDIVLHRYYPSMNLLFDVAGRNAEQFNTDLREAVELHQSFWSADEERATDPDGFWAPGPTALAALAHDFGMPVEVRSPYLPQDLINGTRISP
ncbi:immunity 49 family protein [Saccharopolyspora sp. NPDC047091]|uniref:immunity 49 family protein n=1 Tax=Saccharopolyspora sp. NPDC047091 TaxID=3155924 RepID=UPI0034113695